MSETTAKIAETFISYQGEGPYLGMRQLFIRFFGCSLNCTYCDTKIDSYENPTKEELLKRALEYTEPYSSLSITGGEPLLQSKFLKEFIPMYKDAVQKSIYLESNGVLCDDLKSVIAMVDTVAMDMKLPSSTRRREFWSEHEEFLKIARRKEVFVKAVITGETLIEDVLRAGDIIKNIDRKILFVLQPVDPKNDTKEVKEKTLINFKDQLNKKLEDVRIIPQWHKTAGVR
ncbi:MAG: 7-carboxy-7-deazaguanine synthase QueE [Candidatus Omnitrophica bacterium]|nr:7-carboxy-7-deazaguanine synthase QueE [Candidatus Omnitrophota bacterium]